MTPRHTGLMGSAVTWLDRAWWIAWPALVILVARLALERACADPYRLLASLTSVPATAWPIALAYLGAHAWMFAAYAVTAVESDALWPSLAQARAVWRRGIVKIALMAVTLAVEYLPISLWRAVGTGVMGCAP